ncbi:membrane protein insertase YidC [Actinotalea sp. AC32]|nr:membrane protein insertase YidC [Actinotalea sp. AC32]
MDTILWPLMWVVAWIMVAFHKLLTTLGLDSASGLAWAGSIVGLVIVIRILLIPLFVKQIKASRGMQLVAPEMQKLQARYKGKTDPASREAMTRETMELYKKHGTNPFASCLPILAQSPIFFALFTVLNRIDELSRGDYSRDAIGPLTQDLASEASNATIFGAPISSYFLSADADAATRIVTVVLIVLMSATTFFTQKQLTQKNMPATALQGPMAQQQKILLYVLPLVFAVSGVNFPIGVLIYWTTTNIWSMGQQFYVIRNNPTPGSEAERQLKERRARKAAARGELPAVEEPTVDEKPRGQRQQPKRKDRARGTGPVAPGTAPRTDGPEPASAAEAAGAAGPGGDAPGTSTGPTSAAGPNPRKRKNRNQSQRPGSPDGGNGAADAS